LHCAVEIILDFQSTQNTDIFKYHPNNIQIKFAVVSNKNNMLLSCLKS
jgi:hypothetical protein